MRRTYLPPPKRRDGGSDASKHRDEGLVGCAVHTYAKVVPNCDLVQHGLKAVAEVLLMPHLRATRLDVTRSGAQVCEETHVRITDPPPPSAAYLMVLRGAQSFRFLPLARIARPAQVVASTMQPAPIASS